MHDDDSPQVDPARSAPPRRMPRPRPALLVSFIALFVALGGTGYAAISITGRSIKDGTVTGADVRNGSLQSSDLAPSARPRAGATGPAGRQGARGPQGPAGAQGVSGPQGERGVEGAAGPRGAACDPAVYGEACRGPVGAQGNQGNTGPQGPRGETGTSGETGSQGLTGPRGHDGPEGDRGPQGDPGEPGTDGTLPHAWMNNRETDFAGPEAGSGFEEVVHLGLPPGRYIVTLIGQFTTHRTGITAECQLFADVADPSQPDVDLVSRQAQALENSPIVTFQASVDLTDPRYQPAGNPSARIWVGCSGTDTTNRIGITATLSAFEIVN